MMCHRRSIGILLCLVCSFACGSNESKELTRDDAKRLIGIAVLETLEDPRALPPSIKLTAEQEQYLSKLRIENQRLVDGIKITGIRSLSPTTAEVEYDSADRKPFRATFNLYDDGWRVQGPVDKPRNPE